jgi:hypothetical protein
MIFLFKIYGEKLITFLDVLSRFSKEKIVTCFEDEK